MCVPAGRVADQPGRWIFWGLGWGPESYDVRGAIQGKVADPSVGGVLHRSISVPPGPYNTPRSLSTHTHTQKCRHILEPPPSCPSQVPHNLQGDSTQLDARWWGIVAGVALCCLLAALVFIMGWSKAQSRRRAGGEGGDDYSPVDSAPLRPDARQLSGKSATTDDWVQAVRTKESKIDLVPGQAARKVSNLPA